jgi:hypothetical protein
MSPKHAHTECPLYWIGSDRARIDTHCGTLLLYESPSAHESSWTYAAD